jgi:hypothetical protein
VLEGPLIATGHVGIVVRIVDAGVLDRGESRTGIRCSDRDGRVIGKPRERCLGDSNGSAPIVGGWLTTRRMRPVPGRGVTDPGPRPSSPKQPGPCQHAPIHPDGRLMARCTGHALRLRQLPCCRHGISPRSSETNKGKPTQPSPRRRRPPSLPHPLRDGQRRRPSTSHDTLPPLDENHRGTRRGWASEGALPRIRQIPGLLHTWRHSWMGPYGGVLAGNAAKSGRPRGEVGLFHAGGLRILLKLEWSAGDPFYADVSSRADPSRESANPSYPLATTSEQISR